VTRFYREAGGRVDALREVEGQIGVEQREANNLLRNANSPVEGAYGGLSVKRRAEVAGRPNSADAAKASSGAASAPASGFYFQDRNGASLGSGAAAPTLAIARDQGAVEAKDNEGAKVAENVRSIGRKVFYRRGNNWVDSAVTAEQEKQPTKIERYSKEYFELIDKYGRDVAKYLTFDEPVVIELGGKVYSF